MSENSSPSFEEMAIQQEQGLRPEGNLEDRQFTQSEVLSEEAQAKAENILAEANEAKRNGDQEKVAELTKQIEDDLELSQAIEEHQSDSTEQDLSQIRQAQAELSEKMQRLLGLSNDALSSRAVTESLFRDEDERQRVIQRIKGLESAVSDGDSQSVEQAISEFSNWYQNAQGVIRQRMRAMMGYFGGSLPDRLAAQARLFDQMEDDVNNLNHYLKLSK